MALADYKLLVDWSGDGDYSHPNADITGDLFTVECSRGRDRASSLTGRSTAGKLDAVLANRDGKYSSFNTGSPLHGLILPRRKVQLQMSVGAGWVPLWTGHLNTVIPTPELSGAHTAELLAEGALAGINAGDARVSPRTDIKTGAAINAVLDAINWPAEAREVDEGQTEMRRWWASAKGLQSIRGVEETEAGFIREDRHGDVVFEGRHRRLSADRSLQTQTTYTDETATIGYRGVTQRDPFRDVYRTFRARVTEYEVGAQVTLWVLSGETPSMQDGEARTWWAEYPTDESPPGDVGVEEWADLIAGTDYEANSDPNGGGDDLTTSLSVATSKFANSMRIAITNNASTTAHITLLRARGEPLKQTGTVSVTHEVEDSPVDAEWPSPADFLPDTDEARDHVRFQGSIHGHTVPVLSVSYPAIKSAAHLADAIEREISDRVVVKSDSQTKLGIDEPFFVESIRHEINIQRGRTHQVELELSPVASMAGFWVLGSGALGETTALAY